MIAWKHPEAIMRMRIKSETPMCAVCVYWHPYEHSWCHKHKSDARRNGQTVSPACEDFNDHEMEEPR